MSVDYKKAQRWMKTEQNYLRKYLEQEAQQGMTNFHRKGMEDYLQGKERASFGHATEALSYFSSYFGAQGSLRVLEGDEAGWAELDRACLYSYWSMRIIVAGYDADTNPEKHYRVIMETVAPCWMHAEALGARDILDWLKKRILKLDEGDQAIGGKNMNALCGLMAHFATGLGLDGLEKNGWTNIGPYDKVVEGTLASEVYEELAQYHAQNTGLGGGYKPFYFYPSRLLPCELLAIEKRTGVPITDPKHPLLTSPLATRRTVPEIPLTDELKKIIRKVECEFPL